MLGAFIVAAGGIVASTVWHARLVARLLQAPLLFHQVTPLGRIINRLSVDLLDVDYVLPFTVRSMLNATLQLVAIVTVIGATTPMVMATLPILAVVYYFIQVLAHVQIYKTPESLYSYRDKVINLCLYKYHRCKRIKLNTISTGMLISTT